MSDRPTIFLSAGEASGDQHGAELARSLRRQLPDARLIGLGGSEMKEAGVELIAGLDRLAILGFAEVVRHLPDLFRLRTEVRERFVRESVDLFVPIDYPGFNLPMAKWAHRRETPVIYYIAPQVWAWHESRARRLAEVSDEICVVLPFEEEFLSRYGANVRFVGHPLLDRMEVVGLRDPADRRSAEKRSEDSATNPERPILGLFPGSREQEVRRMLPVFLEAAGRISAVRPDVEIRVARSRDLPGSLFDTCRPGMVSTPEEVVASSRAAITKSGTITLQLALSDVPMVVGYRVNRGTAMLARRLLRIPHIALVNLVADREVVPERVQERMTGRELADAVLPLLDGASPERRSVLEGLALVRSRLGEPGAADRVARRCVAALDPANGAAS
ncbi:MAG: lipid-A-disaccharide synthase [Gemmatimonadota bacterium]